MRADQLNSMQISRNTFFKTQSYNQGVSKNSPIVRDADGNKRRDVAAISPMQRANSMIEALQKQKQNVMEARKELVHKNSAAGKDIDAIKSQLESYNELLSSLDEQIAKVITDLATEEASKLEELQAKLREKAEGSSEGELPKTEDEAIAERMGDIAKADANLDEATRLSAVKRTASSRIAITKSEIAFDESLSGAAPAVGKRSVLKDLEAQVATLNKKIASNVKDANRSIGKSQEEKVTIEDQNHDGAEDKPMLDAAAPPEPDTERSNEPDTTE